MPDYGGGLLAHQQQLLAQALTYAARGWPVFPCRPGRKAPDTPHGFHDATTDPDRIRAWWAAGPAANVAVATGRPGPDVLDIDVTEEGSGWPAFNRLKRAGLLTGARALVRTPRGGLHAYFAGTSQPSGSLTRAGHFIDFKARGGYVLAPPSVVDGKTYELLDERDAAGRLDWPAIRRMLSPPQPPQPARPAAGHDVSRLAAWVAALPEGNRNHGLFWAACRVNGDTRAADQLVAAAVQAGLTEQEARRTCISAAERTSW